MKNKNVIYTGKVGAKMRAKRIHVSRAVGKSAYTCVGGPMNGETLYPLTPPPCLITKARQGVMLAGSGRRRMLNIEEFNGYAKKLIPVGSRITCDPPPTNTDADFLVLVDANNFDAFDLHVNTIGFEMGGSEVLAGGCLRGDDKSFQSYTKGEVNIICTSSNVFFERFMQATELAKELNILNKTYRIYLFQAILYGATT